MPRPLDQFLFLFLNFVTPVLAGLVYFAMARYVTAIRPMRTLMTGELPYVTAYWGFLFMGFYLATRPLQILYPHPWPLIVNNIREFALIGVFGPAVFLGMFSLVFGSESVTRRWLVAVFGVGLILAVIFVITNVYAIGGSERIFQMGRLTAYDGVWFANPTDTQRGAMRILFVVRLLDPVLLVLVAGFMVLWNARYYPADKRALYSNMPLKLYLMAAACFAFSLSVLSVGLLFVFARVANQGWIYYVGALVAGLLETFSLSLPMRQHVQVSEHQ